MFKLGLTGSIATGKSTVLKAFADLGIPTFSSDEAVHRLYEGEAVEPLGRVFPGVVHNGRVDRGALSAHLVAHPEDLGRLEAIVHPLVRQRIRDFLIEAERAGARLAIVDVPLLFETGYDYGFDAVAVTVVDEATQRQRAMARPGMSGEKLDAILARQLPQAEKQRRADYVFDTAKPIRQTEAEVRALVERLGGA
ncbi:MAG TPA: dephospho-CoA kinase [Devosiaceae bacterium]|jgi:dephospho-CoA kinase|nr:dephospho-CoA kinase [Devosiaceae bacterium]